MAEASARTSPRQACAQQQSSIAESVVAFDLLLQGSMNVEMLCLAILGHAGSKRRVTSRNKKRYASLTMQRRPMKS